MTLSAANPGGWSLNEVLTSTQMTFLQNELLKAVDGVGGGTYTLGSVLTFQGADVTFNSDVNLNAGSELNFASGAFLTGQIDVDSNGDMTFLSGSSLTLASGSVLNISGSMTVANLTVTTALSLSSANLNVDAASLVDLLGSLSVHGGGSIDVTSGGDINVTSADVTINGGAQILLNGGSLIIGATGFVQANGGDITLGANSDLILQSNAHIVGQNGSTVTVEDSNDLLINASTETFRLSMTPFYVQAQTTGELRWQQIAVGKWRQQDATTGGYLIAFALPLPPGDVINSVSMTITGGAGLGHSGVLPTIQPELELFSVSTSGTFTTLARTRDNQASAAVYDTSHDVLLAAGTETLGSMPRTVGTDPIYVLVRGEQGGVDNTLELTSVFGVDTANSFRGTGSVMHY